MKIQYKAAGIMSLFGIAILLIVGSIYQFQNNKIIIAKEMENIEDLVEESAAHLDSHLEEQARIALTLSSAPIIHETLLKSNAQYSALSSEERNLQITSLNEQWMQTTDLNDPFILEHLTNPAAEYFKLQQTNFPGLFGEIFLTNRYGVMIASTGKLTTLAHASKYWWQAGYDNGQGRIFFDDRGFDTSVNGYVLGVVIPIKHNNEIIGILKSNINILGPLSDILNEYSQQHTSMLRIVRTGGIIVVEHDAEPLTTQIHTSLIPFLEQKGLGTTKLTEDGIEKLIAYSPVSNTLGSEQYGFGGNYQSIGQIKGNQGEAWHIVISSDTKEVIASSRESLRFIGYIGLIFAMLTIGIALLFGQWVSKPLMKLATSVRILGEGKLGERVEITSKDEIGQLSKDFNKMANDLELSYSELKAAQEQLVRTEKLAVLGQLAGGVGHELRNPLGAIKNAAYFLNMVVDTPDRETKEMLDLLEREVAKTERIVSDLLDFARVKSPFRHKVAINQTIHAALSLIETPDNIQVTSLLAEDLPDLLADPGQLEQIFSNIILNGIQAMPEGGQLTIETRLDNPQWLAVAITDTGSGISPVILAKIFEPLFTTKAKGIGLGLAIIKTLVEGHGGTITASSAGAPGRGSTFTVRLPLQSTGKGE
jgi:signal transduction histidine kinase